MYSFLSLLRNTFALIIDAEGKIVSHSNWFVTQGVTLSNLTHLSNFITNFKADALNSLVRTNTPYTIDFFIKKDRKFFELTCEAIPNNNYLILGNDITELKSTLQELDFISNISELNVTRLHKTLVQLEISKATLLDSKLSKEQMMAHMSHEVRSPLNVIHGFTELLTNTKLSKEQTEYVNAIKFASKNLINLANTILDFSKLEAGKYSVTKSKVNVAELIEATIHAFKIKAQEKQVSITLNNTLATNKLYWIDVTHYSQIIINLLSNALKFTPKGSITITISYSNQELVTIVKDSGIGIPKEHQQSVFDNFEQVPNSPYNTLGTGLGLTIVKQLVTINNGTITLDSIPNQGTTFTITLPTTEGTLVAMPITTIQTQHDLSNYTILVAEDQVLNQTLIRKILTKAKAIVTIVNNGKEAIDIITQNKTGYNLIILDINMPVLDGIATLEILRNELNYYTPIICLTADVNPAAYSKVMIAGGNGVITKPFQINDLINIITTQIQYEISFEYFDNLAANDTIFRNELISSCISTIKADTQALATTYATNEYKKAIGLMHNLKGTTAMFYCSAFNNEITGINTTINERELTQGEHFVFLEKLNSFIYSILYNFKI